MTAPQTDDVSPPYVRPDSMASEEKMRVRAAAFRATKLYPGPVGQVLSRELHDWEEFGYRFGGHGLVAELVNHILRAPCYGSSGPVAA